MFDFDSVDTPPTITMTVDTPSRLRIVSTMRSCGRCYDLVVFSYGVAVGVCRVLVEVPMITIVVD